MTIPTEPVGSIPRTKELIAALGKTHGSDPALEPLYEAAVRDTIARFEQTGSPVITDGEQRKYHNFWTYCVEGLPNTSPDGFKIPFAAGHVRRMLRLTDGPFRYQNRADKYLDAAIRLAHVPVKQAVISPSALSLMYPVEDIAGYSRDQFVDDLLREHENEVRACLKKGAHKVQIDFTEGRLAVKVDPSGELLHRFIELNNLALSRFSAEERKRIGVHTCPGGDRDSTHSADVDYAELLPSLFELRVGNFYIALAGEKDRARVLEVIRDHMKADHRVFVGVVAPIDPHVETPEEVRDRVLEAAQYIPVEQLGTTDDCGFAPFAMIPRRAGKRLLKRSVPACSARNSPRRFSGASNGGERRRGRTASHRGLAKRKEHPSCAQRAEDALREQREWFRVTLSSIGDAVIATDIEGRVSFLNHVAESLTGWTDSEAKGQPLDAVFRIINEETRQAVENPATRALQEGTIVGLTNHSVLIAKDGTERPIDDSVAPIRGKEGEVVGCVLVFRDVSERRRWEKENASRLAAARLLASIVESSEDAIVSKSLDGVIQSWNAGAERIFGYTAEQAVGRHISLIIPEDRADEEASIIARIRAGERIEHFDTIRTRSDGRSVQISLTISPVRDEDGRVIGASKIARDITRRKAAEEALRQLAADLSDSNRRKEEFLATLAHELRGPLAPLRSALAILNVSEDGGTLAETRGMMERQLNQMVRLIDDLLDVSRISSGKLELRNERVELASIIHHAVEAIRPLAVCGSHEITVTLPPEPIYLYADAARLQQVFSNLLNNSCKYSEAHGKIGVTAELQGSDVVVTVKDTGIGIPTDKLDSIFQMFSQVDQSLERSKSGLGIGLTLVKRLVELHGGSILAHSEGLGKGSEFIVRLPLLIESAKQVQEIPSEEPPTPDKRRILVVDDNRDSADTLAMLLKMTGSATHTAYDGQQAVDAAAKLRPDVILLDIGLPKLNGYEACRRIREQPWGKKVIIVALTGWGQEDDRRKSSEAGFNSHLVKPVDYAALMKLLTELQG